MRNSGKKWNSMKINVKISFSKIEIVIPNLLSKKSWSKFSTMFLTWVFGHTSGFDDGSDIGEPIATFTFVSWVEWDTIRHQWAHIDISAIVFKLATGKSITNIVLNVGCLPVIFCALISKILLTFCYISARFG